MLDIKIIRDNADQVEKALARRNGGYSLGSVLEVDQHLRQVQSEWESLNQRSNVISETFKTGKADKEQIETLRKESKDIKSRREELDALKLELESRLDDLRLALPNVPHPSVPDGKDENDNVEIKTWGKIPDIKDPKPHFELGPVLGVFDFERGVKLSESRFTLLDWAGAKLERALMNFYLDTHSKRGYKEVFPPILVNRSCMIGTGQLPKFDGEFYKCADDDLYLVPTAEVPLTNIYREEVLNQEDLPIYLCAYTPNFRREAGSAGKDTRGYIRQHQFNKVELVKFCLPENSLEELEKLTSDAEHVLEQLELPYRRIALCTGDLGLISQKTYDLEVWFPAQNKYREISSCSMFGDYQSRRANIRFKSQDGGKPKFVHTLNGSGVAIGRTLAAILENYQRPDGSVAIPKVLVPYLGGLTELLPKG
jgi:seryl-tRNA synthetase